MPSLADQFTDKQINEFKEAFNLFDKDADGEVMEGQLHLILRALGIHVSEERVLVLLKGKPKATTSSLDSTVDFPEFLALIGKISNEETDEEHIREALRVFDKDEDGFLTIEELKRIMMSQGEKISQPEFNEMIASCNITEDGLIDYEAFAQLIGKK